MGRKGRAPAGQGTVTQRADGRWEARLDLGYQDGKRVRKSYYGATQAEALRKLKRGQADQAAGRPLVDERTTVGQHLDEWLEAVRPSLRQTSVAAYDLNVRRAKSIIGRTKLAQLNAPDLQRLYARLLEHGFTDRPLSRRSVEQCHTVLHKAFKQAVAWGRMARNPCDYVEVPRPRRAEMRTLSQEQVARLLESTADDDLYTLWALLATTGLRVGEALGLQWADVDLDGATLQVRRTLQHNRLGPGLVLVEPKTKSSRRTVHLTSQFASTLRDHRKQQNANGLGWRGDNFVFTTAAGEPIGPRNVGYYLSRALAKAGLPQVRVHDLRHTAATLLLKWGTHPKVVQEMLGHSTIAITLDLYSHTVPTMHRDAAQQFGRIFRQVTAVEASS